MARPDYATARQRAGFRWWAEGSQDTLRRLAGTPIREFNLDPAVCIETYRKGRPLHLEMFGPDVRLPGLCTPAISYGHVNGVGSELIFPEGGEVSQTHIYGSLKEGIAALKKPVDFARAGRLPFYMEFRRQMQNAFPDEPVGFGCCLEGPITTAWLLRGEGFFTDIYDDPPAAHEFLRLIVDSTLAFHRFLCEIDKRPVVNPDGGGLTDDLASMVPPDLWPEFVLPYWERYCQATTTGPRRARVEDLRPAQLHYLETAGLESYDPSISPMLNPRIIAAECRVPFGWRLGSFHYRDLDCRGVEDFVFQATADDASYVFTCTESIMCNEADVKKMHAFIGAAKKVEAMLKGGADRRQVGRLVSASGQTTFWEHWSGFKG